VQSKITFVELHIDSKIFFAYNSYKLASIEKFNNKNIV